MSEHLLFTKLYDEHSEAIFRFVFARVRSQETAEDITQDVFIRALPRIRENTLVSSTALPYLYTIARNALTDFYRKKKATILEQDDDIFFVEDEGALGATDSFALLVDDRALLTRALSTLGDEQQTILALHFMEELSFAEIAKVLGKREEAVRQHKSRALSRLREYFIQNDPEHRTI